MDGYDNFFLPVNDMARAREYYQDLLGLDVKFDFSDRGMLAYRVGQEEPALILKDISKFPDTKPTIWFVVPNVSADYERLRSRGIQFLSAPFELRTGLAVEFEDPFGNRLGITDYSRAQPAR